MKLKKSISLITTAALVTGSFGGCSLFDGKIKEEITESLSEYMEDILAADYEQSRQFVEGREDCFYDNSMEPMQAKIVETVFAQTEFEIGEITVDRPSATAEVILSMPDIYTLENEGYNFYEYMDAISGIDDRVEETLEFTFNKNDDAWLIDPSSTEDFYAFCLTIGEGIDFGPLNEYTAVAAVDSFIGLLAQGNVTDALAMTPYSDLSSSLDGLDGLSNIMSVYFTSLIYALEVTDITDEQVTVAISGSAPDVEVILTMALENREQTIASISEAINQRIGGDDTTIQFISIILESVFDNVDPERLATADGTFIITADENGNLIVNPQPDLIPFDLPEF